ncbi:MAG: calcium-binding protein, partial [Actinomycetota bacterium]
TFPEVGGPDTSYNGGPDAFVAKVAPAGTALSYAGYIGGSTEDYASDVAVDGGGAAYVVGFTDSPQASFPDGDGFGPLTGPDTTYNGDPYDAFVVKVVPAGSSLGYAGYVGGSGDEAAQSVAVDGGGAAYLTGRTDSTEDTFPDGDGFGPLTGPDPTYNGGLADVFVAQVAAAGTSFASAGYLGGAAHDQGLGIAVDGTGAAYVTGETGSNQDTFPDGDGLGPLPGPDTTQNSMEDAFVAKIAEPAQPIGATCRGKTATVVGTPGNDTLTGTSGRDVVAALGGKDKVRTLGGKDLVCAGGGNDTANGGGGKDKLFGEGGKDRLKGAGGNDRLNGGPKKDTCVGGPGKRDKARKCEKEKSIP